MSEYEGVECIPQRNPAPNLADTTRCCSLAEQCVSYAALGVSAKLSRGNPGPWCFACVERHAAVSLSEAEAKASAKRSGKVKARAGQNRREPTCAKGSCERPAVEWQQGARVCWEHAEAARARQWQEECSTYVRSCDVSVRKALGAGDEALARNWSGSLKEARRRLARAEAALAAAEAAAGAHPEPRFPRFAV